MDLTNEERIDRLEISISETENEIKQIEFLLTEMKLNKDKVKTTNSREVTERIITELEKESEWLNNVLEEEFRSLEFVKNSF